MIIGVVVLIFLGLVTQHITGFGLSQNRFNKPENISSESYGGYTAYLTESEEILQLSPSPNTLSFVERNKGVMRYVKYVQHKQKSPLVFVMGTLCMGR